MGLAMLAESGVGLNVTLALAFGGAGDSYSVGRHRPTVKTVLAAAATDEFSWQVTVHRRVCSGWPLSGWPARCRLGWLPMRSARNVPPAPAVRPCISQAVPEAIRRDNAAVRCAR